MTPNKPEKGRISHYSKRGAIFAILTSLYACGNDFNDKNYIHLQDAGKMDHGNTVNGRIGEIDGGKITEGSTHAIDEGGPKNENELVNMEEKDGGKKEPQKDRQETMESAEISNDAGVEKADSSTETIVNDGLVDADGGINGMIETDVDSGKVHETKVDAGKDGGVPDENDVASAFDGGLNDAGDTEVYMRENQTHVITPTCDDLNQRTYETVDGITYHDFECLPDYYYKNGGNFLSSTNQPIPKMGGACGDYSVLVAFVDTPENRNLLMENSYISDQIKSELGQDMRRGLEQLFSEQYLPQNVFLPTQRYHEMPPITLNFDIKVLDDVISVDDFAEKYYAGSTNEGFTPIDEAKIADFMNHDAVLFLDDIEQAGWGISKFPLNAIFNPNYFLRLIIDPTHLSPGLFFNEMFRRNMPETLSLYELGEVTTYEENGITYATQAIINPRTDEDLRSYFGLDGTYYMTSVLSGWMDVDRDGITDCTDAIIQTTEDNVDADLIPDVLDPDLDKDNGAYFWKFQEEK